MKWVLFVVGVLAVVTFMIPNSSEEKARTVSYSEFMEAVEAATVAKVTVDTGARKLRGEKKDGSLIETHYAGIDNIAEQLRSKVPKVEVKTASGEDRGITSIVINILTWGLILVCIIFFFSYMMRRMGPGNTAHGFNKSPLKRLDPKEISVSFDDVLGVDEAKEGVQEYKNFLMNSQKFGTLGARLPKGVLLVGPPGTGKTLLAKATACEAGVPFFFVSGSEFVEMFVGVGASRIRSMEAELRKHAPCICFIDELDAVGRHRGSGVGHTNDEREQTLNQLLVVIDGFDPSLGVIFMAATNRPDVLDPALTRAGRFDRCITLGRPDVRGREAILVKYATKKPLWEDVELESIAKLTPGSTGADLENLVNEAALTAARLDRNFLTMHDFNDALDKLLLGPAKSVILSESLKRRICVHEAGHSIVAMFTEGANPLHKVSVIPRGSALGVTVMLPESDLHLMTQSQLEAMIAVSFGGRSAEKAVFGDLSTGASDDLLRATGIVRDMVARYGMSEKLGPMAYATQQGPMFLGRELSNGRDHSDITANRIEDEVRQILTKKERGVDEFLKEKRHLIDSLAEALFERETMSRQDIEELFLSVNGTAS